MRMEKINQNPEYLKKSNENIADPNLKPPCPLFINKIFFKVWKTLSYFADNIMQTMWYTYTQKVDISGRIRGGFGLSNNPKDMFLFWDFIPKKKYILSFLRLFSRTIFFSFFLLFCWWFPRSRSLLFRMKYVGWNVYFF